MRAVAGRSLGLVIRFGSSSTGATDMEVKTYSNRNNARRAGVQAGIPSERVEITVHKNGDDVRFDRRANEAVESPPVIKQTGTRTRPTPETRNGIGRPAPGGACCAIWDWLDMNPMASLGQAKREGISRTWNAHTLTRQFYQWRRYASEKIFGSIES